jgi:hypothetical protein
MGTLAGHLLPGTFFAMFAIYWSFITAIRYAQSKKRSPFDKNRLVGYRSTVTMPCIMMPCRGARRAPMESYMKVVFGTLGLLGEVVTGVKFNYVPEMNKDDAAMFGCDGATSAAGGHGGHEMIHDHVHDPSMGRTTVERVHIEHVNAQHITMYAGNTLSILDFQDCQVAFKP